jgi:hypothetical protein
VVRVPKTFSVTFQTAVLNDSLKFTGDSKQKVNEFIDAVEHIGSFTSLNDAALWHAFATIKLGGLAVDWYDSDKFSLTLGIVSSCVY